MSYLANKTRVSSLTVGGVDYTNAFKGWTATDTSAYKSGCIQTSGRLTLGTVPGGALIEDYDRNNFKRGTEVILELVEPGGSTYRHPRGFLYVISCSYDIEQEVLEVEIGCRLVLMALTEEIDDLVSLLPVALDVVQTTFQNCSAAFASVGKYVYQDNVGALQVGVFFDGDSTMGVAPGQWTSVLGKTALSVQPLAGTEAIPDQISLSYQVPTDGLSGDQKGLIETTETLSYYFLNYPVTVYVRVNGDASSTNPNGTLGNIQGTQGLPPRTEERTSACGNSPDRPSGAGNPASCNEGYELTNEQVYLPAFKREIEKTYYDGPGGQVSRRTREVYGPVVELSQQYYADKFVYCRNSWATKCNPNGSCPFEGMTEALLGKAETINYFGEANEVVRTITDSYSPIMRAAQPSDWRSAVVRGVPQDFNQNLSYTTLYRDSRSQVETYKEGEVNIQKTTNFASLATRGVGIYGKIDALEGVKSVVIRKSTSNNTVDVSPDIINSPTTDTKEERTNIVLFASRFKDQPEEAGPYILEEQIPVPLLFATRAEIDQAVADYENYLVRFIKGDTFGLQVGEGMRSEVATGWFPGMPFRYSDPRKDKVFAMRMDATVWGVSETESAFVTNGVWIGNSNGSVVIPSNVVGNSMPDMGSGALPPTAIVPPSITNETSVDSGSFSWQIDVFLSFSSEMIAYGNDGVLPPPPSAATLETKQTFTVFVGGIIVGPGDVLATDTGGSIPLELFGSLVVADATVVSDMFA